MKAALAGRDGEGGTKTLLTVFRSHHGPLWDGAVTAKTPRAQRVQELLPPTAKHVQEMQETITLG